MKVVPATPDLVPTLLKRMGPARTAALAERVGCDPGAEISTNIKRSAITWACLDKAGIVALGGAIPQGDGAYIWAVPVVATAPAPTHMLSKKFRHGVKLFRNPERLSLCCIWLTEQITKYKESLME